MFEPAVISVGISNIAYDLLSSSTLNPIFFFKDHLSFNDKPVVEAKVIDTSASKTIGAVSVSNVVHILAVPSVCTDLQRNVLGATPTSTISIL